LFGDRVLENSEEPRIGVFRDKGKIAEKIRAEFVRLRFLSGPKGIHQLLPTIL
jgi:hypothetical protein